MIIIGHRLIKFEPFTAVSNFDEVAKYDNLLFKFNPKFIESSQILGKKFSVRTNKIQEIILANAAGASFIVVDKKFAKTAQDLAGNYLFDAKIACIISSERHLKDLAEIGVDAAIFKNGIRFLSHSFLPSFKPKFALAKLEFNKFKKQTQSKDILTKNSDKIQTDEFQNENLQSLREILNKKG